MKPILAKEGTSQLIQMQKACVQDLEKKIGYGEGGWKHCLDTEGQNQKGLRAQLEEKSEWTRMCDKGIVQLS